MDTKRKPKLTARKILEKLARCPDPLVAAWAKKLLATQADHSAHLSSWMEHQRKVQANEAEQRRRDEQYARELADQQAAEEDNRRLAAAHLKRSVRKLISKGKK